MSIPIFALLELLVSLLKPSGAPIPTLAVPTPNGNGQPPPFEMPTGPPPDLTWLLIVLVLVGVFVLLRIVASFLAKPAVNDWAGETLETRASEPITLPSLPARPRLRWPHRQQTPGTASEAYQLSLVALAGGPEARLVGETPSEHAMRIVGTGVGRDVGRLATDYQLGEFAAVRLTTRESRRALERWRRVVRHVGRRR